MKCKDCNERFIGCHSVCPSYLSFIAENEKLKEAKRQDKQIRGYTGELALRIYKTEKSGVYRKKKG